LCGFENVPLHAAVLIFGMCALNRNMLFCEGLGQRLQQCVESTGGVLQSMASVYQILQRTTTWCYLCMVEALTAGIEPLAAGAASRCIHCCWWHQRLIHTDTNSLLPGIRCKSGRRCSESVEVHFQLIICMMLCVHIQARWPNQWRQIAAAICLM
jgi:hypothetical protein